MRYLSPALVLFAFTIIISCNYPAESSDPVQEVSSPAEPDTVAFEQVEAELDTYGFRTDTLEVEDFTVKKNESFYLILDKFNFSPQEIYNITRQAREVIDVRYMKPGQPYRTYASTDPGSISRLIWQPNPVDYVVFEWQDSLNIYTSSKSITTLEVIASATINNSLYEAMQEEGMSPLLAYKLSEIYAWEIDFYRLQKGDNFQLLYEKKYIDEEEFAIGDILSVKFEHRGKLFAAYKFDGDKVSGYFDEAGNSMQKALLKVPFKYNQRISSGYSSSRFHPVLKRRRPHYGVDYAAPYGTPVLAVGDGTVTEAQYRGANGNIIKIRHNVTYQTAYLHLKSFAKGIRSGATVRQGQIIGYVGNTGRVTGTHLDYRIYRNNSPVNPLTVDLPASESVPESDMPVFKQIRDNLNARLDRVNQPNNKQGLISEINIGLPAAGKNSSGALRTTHWYKAR